MVKNAAELIETIRTYGFEYFGLYYGIYRGVVESIEDPEQLGRVQIKVPELFEDEVITNWAWPSSQFKGFVTPVEVGDGVNVQFHLGKAENPIITGYWWGKPDDVTEYPDVTDYNKKYILVTPNGNKIEINDETNEILIESQADYKIKVTLDDSTQRLSASETITYINNSPEGVFVVKVQQL